MPKLMLGKVADIELDSARNNAYHKAFLNGSRLEYDGTSKPTE